MRVSLGISKFQKKYQTFFRTRIKTLSLSVSSRAPIALSSSSMYVRFISTTTYYLLITCDEPNGSSIEVCNHLIVVLFVVLLFQAAASQLLP